MTMQGSCKYDILARDLDGTLLRSDGTVSPASIAAIERARKAGLRVIVCTGRGWVECKHILEQIRQSDPVVVAGGAIVAEA
ncbi:MAG: HAD-IIB family hydrolase, partial [Phycisphaerae bacterium]